MDSSEDSITGSEEEGAGSLWGALSLPQDVSERISTRANRNARVFFIFVFLLFRFLQSQFELMPELLKKANLHKKMAQSKLRHEKRIAPIAATQNLQSAKMESGDAFLPKKVKTHLCGNKKIYGFTWQFHHITDLRKKQLEK